VDKCLPLLKDLKPKLNLNQRPDIRVTILGVGSDLRSDDGAGVRAIERLQEIGALASHARVQLEIGANAPENVTGAIIKFNPTHLMVIDAADFNASPGTVTLINPDFIEGVTFSSHMMPLRVVLNYLGQYIKPEPILVGIQPASVEFGFDLCESVDEAVNALVETLKEALLGA
jgi:hydrogenase 3 maturation protease